MAEQIIQGLSNRWVEKGGPRKIKFKNTIYNNMYTCACRHMCTYKYPHPHKPKGKTKERYVIVLH